MIRKLQKSDLQSGFLKLLSQLSETPLYFSDEEYKLIMNQDKEIYIIEEAGQIVGTGSILFERKFIHKGIVGHIEDVVIDKNKRGNGYGKMIIERLIEEGKERNVYKIILNCDEKNIKFYEKCGLEKKEIEMVKYF